MNAPSEATFTGQVQVGSITVQLQPKKMTITDGGGRKTYAVIGQIGVAPLQQFLLQGEGGRQLVAPIAWDIEKKRWFDPSPEGAVGDPADPLYWAGLAGTWNHMCADCHTTAYNKGYDVATARYQPASHAPDVGCAACHGPNNDADLSTAAAEVEVCAPCHSRREPLRAGWHPGEELLDYYLPTLLDNDAYTDVGGLKAGEEVFEYGSFLQSRMYAKGVRCSDCHDPHSADLRAEGNALCTRCHEAGTYDGVGHPKADVPNTTDCVTCHMPTMTYMGVDPRHDHYIRTPTSARAASSIVSFTAALAAGRRGDPSAVPALLQAVADADLGGFRRASALTLLARFPPAELTAVRAALMDPDPLVRQAAVTVAGAWGAPVEAALKDPVYAVRLAALKATLGQPVQDRAAQQAVYAEVQAAASANADLPSTWSNLAVFHWGMGDIAAARAALEQALRIDPAFSDARTNLAALLARSGDRAGAQRVLDGGKP